MNTLSKLMWSATFGSALIFGSLVADSASAASGRRSNHAERDRGVERSDRPAQTRPAPVRPSSQRPRAVVTPRTRSRSVHRNHDRHMYRVGHRVNTLPAGHSRVRVGHRSYFYRAGVFFRPVGRRYKVVAAPIGAVVPYLPRGAVKVYRGARALYLFQDSCFRWSRSLRAYVVVAPPAHLHRHASAYR